MGMGGSQPAVEMRGITKVYPDGVVALRDVDFTVRKGEVHGLLGENGAGKTTLMRILYGEIEPSKGEIWIFGRRVKFRGPWDAIRQGVYMVYQQFSLVPAFTVLENLILASSSMGRAKLQDVRRKAEKIEREIGLEVPLNARVEELSVGVQQKAEILKALMSEAKILVLDEPTSVLTPIEVRELMKLLSRLREMGITIIFITHKLREAKEITDRITVLRRGRVVKVVETRDMSQEELAKMMVGREITFDITKKAAKVGAPLLVVKDLWVRDDRGLMAVKGVSFELRAGEILSIVGVAGNGQRELVEAIVGIRPVEKGEVVFSGESITQMPPSEVYRRGLVYIPDSRTVGLILDFNVTDNSILTRLKQFLSGGRILWGEAQRYSSRIVKEFNVLVDSLRTPVRHLSGGNQQRLLVGREVASNPKVIIAAEPTHGLDVAATEYIRSLLLKLRDEGKAVLLVSTDLDEVFQLSDRMAVIYEGQIMATGRPEEFTAEELGLLMGGVKCEAKS